MPCTRLESVRLPFPPVGDAPSSAHRGSAGGGGAPLPPRPHRNASAMPARAESPIELEPLGIEGDRGGSGRQQGARCQERAAIGWAPCEHVGTSGDLFSTTDRPTVSLGVTSAVVCTYGCGDGRIGATRYAVRDYLPLGVRDKHQDTEERREAKVACSVLKQREAERSASRL